MCEGTHTERKYLIFVFHQHGTYLNDETNWDCEPIKFRIGRGSGIYGNWELSKTGRILQVLGQPKKLQILFDIEIANKMS